MTDDTNRTTKKTEMIEVRVSHETKRDFLAACRSNGRTASDVVRGSIDDYIAAARRAPAPPLRSATLMSRVLPGLRRKRYLAAGAAMLGLTATAAMPSAAQTDLAAVFNAMDTNRDGTVSLEEYVTEYAPVIGGVPTKQFKVRVGVQGHVPDGTQMAFSLPPEPDGKAPEGREVSYQTFGSEDPPTLRDRRSKHFNLLDSNGDGQLALDEFRSFLTAQLSSGYARLDANSDGQLSTDEYRKMAELDLVASPPDAYTRIAGPASFGPAASVEALDRRFREADADGDGNLSLEEYLP